MDGFSLTPLAVAAELRQGLVEMYLQEEQSRLVTVGYDRVIMVWSVEKML